MTLVISVHDDLPADAARIDAGLGDFNDAAAPLHEVRPLSCFARDTAGAVVGGLVGRTWGPCAEIQQLWVAEACRGEGIATRLVEAFEARASARGCRSFYLETFDFQAPGFYEKLGYRRAFALDVYPHGIVKFTMLREAGEPGPAA